mgnify:CR=1 FL=1
MKTVWTMVVCGLLLLIPSAASAESAGAPMPEPGHWDFDGVGETLTIPTEGAFVVDVRWSSTWSLPEFTVEVLDAADAPIDGEAEYDGRHGIIFRAAAPLAAGALATAHVTLEPEADSRGQGVTTLELALTVTDEETPALVAPTLTDLAATTRPDEWYSCRMPTAALSWEPASPPPGWLSPLLTYSLMRLDEGQPVPFAEHVEAPMGTLYTLDFWPLREEYCFQVVATSLIDGEAAATEQHCFTAEDYEAGLAEGEVLCTKENLDDHELDPSAVEPNDPPDAPSSSSGSGGCAGGSSTPGAPATWLLVLLLIAYRRQAVPHG